MIVPPPQRGGGVIVTVETTLLIFVISLTDTNVETEIVVIVTPGPIEVTVEI